MTTDEAIDRLTEYSERPKCSHGKVVSPFVKVLLARVRTLEAELAVIRQLREERDHCEQSMRELAYSLSVGGLNSSTFDPEKYRQKISDGIDTIVRVEASRREQAEAELEGRKMNLRKIAGELASALAESAACLKAMILDQYDPATSPVTDATPEQPPQDAIRHVTAAGTDFNAWSRENLEKLAVELTAEVLRLRKPPKYSDADVERLVDAAKLMVIEMAYLIEQVKARPDGSVCRAYEAGKAALAPFAAKEGV